MTATLGSARFQQAYPAYEKKISTAARNHHREIPNMPASDLEIELQEVLWLACEKYDPNRGATFNTCFWEFANNRIKDLKKAAFRQKRLADLNTISLEEDALRAVVYGEQADRSSDDGQHSMKVRWWEHADYSSEEEALARLEVQERYRSGQRPSQRRRGAA